MKLLENKIFLRFKALLDEEGYSLHYRDDFKWRETNMYFIDICKGDDWCGSGISCLVHDREKERAFT